MHSLWQQFPFWCAPMEGVMHPAVTAACSRLELVETCLTPFLRISGHAPKAAQITAFLAPFGPDARPVVLQLMGTEPVPMGECAALALRLGAAGIDLNLGCPSRQVTRHGAGAGALRPAALPDTLRVAEALRKVAPEGCFSIKMRCGWQDFSELAELLPALCRAAAPDAVTIHFRTAQEGYRPVPERLERFAAIGTLAASLPVRWLLNGDLRRPGEVLHLMRETGASGAMIGRGFWRDPWILRKLRRPDATFPPPADGRRRLWEAILREFRRQPRCASRGRAVELAHLILGGDSPAAAELRALPDAAFAAWLTGRTTA